jgi:hypothetical protein
MSWSTIPSAWIAAGEPLKQELFQAIKDDLDYLYNVSADTQEVQSISSTQALTVTKGLTYVMVDSTAGDVTLTLPAAASYSDFEVVVKKIKASNSVIVDGSLTETIDSSASVTLTDRYAELRVVSDGTEWHVIGGNVHNSLVGKQGGTTNEYYHLTSAQHTNATSASPTFATSVTSPIIYGGSGDDADLTLESSSGTPSATSFINFGASGAAGQINRNTKAWTIPVSLTVGTASTPSGYTPSTLDSYQHEGAWTPTDASGASLSLTVANCHFTRIGRLCICYCQISYPSTADGSAALIGGLPFTSKNDSGGTGCGFVGYTNLGQEVSALVTANATTFSLYGTSAGFTNANMSLKQVRLCIIYPIKT